MRKLSLILLSLLVIGFCQTGNAEIQHNHGPYTYEPVINSRGENFNCPCEVPARGYDVTRGEFAKQEEIQDLIRNKEGKFKKRIEKITGTVLTPSNTLNNNSTPQYSGKVYYDMDDILMQTTIKEEFEDFFKRYVSRKYPCNEVSPLNFAKPSEGDLKILVGMDGFPAVISRNENANLYGIKIGSVTWKYVQVPVRVEGYRYTNNRWTSLGALKVLSEQTIKDDPRKIYKNAMNDAINYYTSPKNMINQALFEYGKKHRSVFDHVTNW